MRISKPWFLAGVFLGVTLATAAPTSVYAAAQGYVQTNLISDISGLAAHTDTNLRNPWGIAFFPGAPFWVNNNGAGTSALYFGTGEPNPQLPFVTIPTPSSSSGGTPTGIVANILVGSGAFHINIGANDYGQSLFIFATEDGTIQAWNIPIPQLVSPGIPDPTHAVIVANNSAADAVYKGLAIGSNSNGQARLFATNFHSGQIDVFDTNFHQIPLSGKFADPKLQAGYAPFGIQNINNKIWVTYALQDADKEDDVAKPAHGFVDVFDTDGNLLSRFTQHGHLNSPWGIALAPAAFGRFSNDILIGNFGDGTINAYDPVSGHWLGTLRDVDGRPLVNEGLWALTFGGAANSSPNTLYFSAGLNGEEDGLFGSIQPQ